MDSLGMIETKGLIAAVEACDVMLKTADVYLVGKRKSTAGLVTILIKGDVAAVKASVEAGSAAAENVSPGSLLASHVIARPIEEIHKSYDDAPCKEKVPETIGVAEEVMGEVDEKSFALLSEETHELVISEPAFPVEVETTQSPEQSSIGVTKDILDALFEEGNVEGIVAKISSLSVSNLRHLVRSYDDIGIAGRSVSSANRKELLSYLKSYYSKD